MVEFLVVLMEYSFLQKTVVQNVLNSVNVIKKN